MKSYNPTEFFNNICKQFSIDSKILARFLFFNIWFEIWCNGKIHHLRCILCTTQCKFQKSRQRITEISMRILHLSSDPRFYLAKFENMVFSWQQLDKFFQISSKGKYLSFYNHYGATLQDEVHCTVVVLHGICSLTNLSIGLSLWRLYVLEPSIIYDSSFLFSGH